MFADEADHRLKERMSWTYESCDWLLVDLAFIETDAFVFLLDRRTRSDLSVSLANAQRYMGDLPSTFFPLLDLAAEMLEGFDEEALYMVGLEPLGIGALYLHSELMDAGRWHCVVCQSTSFQQGQEMLLIHSAIYGSEKPRLNFILLTILDGFKKQIAEGRPLEQLSQYIVDSSPERLAGDFQLFQQSGIYLALPSVGCHQVP
ncbi:hypothetical protein D3C73_367540 [compost metagenome]